MPGASDDLTADDIERAREIMHEQSKITLQSKVTLLDYIKEPIKLNSPIVHCSTWHQDKPLNYCLEQCISQQCLDLDQINKLQLTIRGQ